MDWQHPIVGKLAAIVQSMDDEALAQLANAGLLRRARKDAAAAPPRLVIDGAQACVETGGQTVRLAALPSDCRCDCPASGICRHVLAALLFLREQAPRSAANDGRAELLALDEAAVAAWAGKAVWRAAHRALAEGMAVEIEEGGVPRMTLPALGARCRWLPGGGLAGMLCSCPSPSPCTHRAIAVLAFLVREGRVAPAADEAPDAAAGAGASGELLAGVRGLLGEIVSIGLSRVSSATAERFQTLAISAHTADLPRLERMLAALASGAALQVKRDSQASVAEMLALAARIEALACALAHPNGELVGQHRSRYLEIGECELWGAGARQWRSRSGYLGLTLYFWEPLTRRWRTWTAARPVGTPGFSPQREFDAAGPWEGCHSPREAAGCRVRLHGAWRSAGGRLSGRPSTTALTAGATIPDRLPALGDWSQLRAQALALFGGGLGEFEEAQEIVLLRPAYWAAAQFDQVRQRAWRAVADAGGRILPLTIPYNAETAAAVRLLEEHAPADGSLALALLRLVDGVLCAEPVSLIEDGRVLSLTLAGPGAGQAEARAVAAADGADESAEEPDVNGSIPGAAGALLIEALAEMEQIAETGLGAAPAGERFRENAGRAKALFLATPAAALERLAEALDRARRGPAAETRAAAASALLRAYYVASLARRLEVVERALAPLNVRIPMGSVGRC